MPPMAASRIDSPRNWVRIWLLVAPRARRRPISERRSSTEMIMMLATPTAPTIRDTTPSPRKRLSNGERGRLTPQLAMMALADREAYPARVAGSRTTGARRRGPLLDAEHLRRGHAN